MNRRLFAASLALAVSSVLGLAPSVTAAEQVPLKGSLKGVVTRGIPSMGSINILVEGEGTATQLGAFAFVFPHTVTLATRIAEGTYHMVAANGDVLTAKGTGFASDTETPGVLYIVETLTIEPASSTGRFAGATGGFQVERLYDGGNPGLTVGSFAGTISIPGAGGP